VGDFVVRLRRRDPRAVRELRGRFEKQVARFLVRLVGNETQAAALTDEVFTRAVHSVEEFHGRNEVALRVWIYRIAVLVSNKAQTLDS
jgi:DNA-directed RNA polymerase specialized sigma24 family protein